MFHSLGNTDNILLSRDVPQDIYVIDRQMPTVKYSTMSPEMKAQQLRRLRALIHEAKSLLDLPSQQIRDDVKSNASDMKNIARQRDRVAERFMRNYRDVYDLKEQEIKLAVRITLRSDKLHVLFQNETFRNGYLHSQIRDLSETREKFPKFSTTRDFVAFNTKHAHDIKLSGMRVIAKGFIDAARRISRLNRSFLYRFPDSIKKKNVNDKRKSKLYAEVFERCDANYFKAIMSVMSSVQGCGI